MPADRVRALAYADPPDPLLIAGFWDVLWQLNDDARHNAHTDLSALGPEPVKLEAALYKCAPGQPDRSFLDQDIVAGSPIENVGSRPADQDVIAVSAVLR